MRHTNLCGLRHRLAAVSGSKGALGHARGAAYGVVALNEAALERDALDVAMAELADLFTAGGNARSPLFVASTGRRMSASARSSWRDI